MRDSFITSLSSPRTVRFTEEGILWIVGARDLVLRGVFDDHPRIERIDLRWPRHDFLDVFVRSERDVWIAGQSYDFARSGTVKPWWGDAFHWDGCHWQRRLDHRPAYDPGGVGSYLGSFAQDGQGRFWSATNDGRLLRLEDDHWVETPSPEEGNPTVMRSTGEGEVYLFSRRFDPDQISLYLYNARSWRDASPPMVSGWLDDRPIAVGHSWIAIFARPTPPGTTSQTAPTLWVRRAGQWSTLRAPTVPGALEEWTTSGLVVDDTLIFQSSAGYWWEGRAAWQPEALQARLHAQGRDVLDGFTVIASQRPLDTLDGVRWYLADNRLVGCRLSATEARCIGAVDARFDLTSTP